MNREDRAKQFAPFDALKGLQEALRAKEELHERVARREVPAEVQDEMNETFAKIDKFAYISVIFYSAGRYLEAKGRVTEIDPVYKFLKFGELKIFFCDIYQLHFEKEEP